MITFNIPEFVPLITTYHPIGIIKFIYLLTSIFNTHIKIHPTFFNQLSQQFPWIAFSLARSIWNDASLDLEDDFKNRILFLSVFP